MKTLWIHIGMAKTGSTAIQFFCKENADVLAKKGYGYPALSFHYPGISKAHNGRFLLGMLIDENGNRDLEQEDKNFQAGMQMVDELFLEYDNVVLSDESIWRGMDMEKKNLWELLMEKAKKGGYGIRVIVYFRRQDKFFPSNWNQLVKKQWSQETFAQYTGREERYFLNYYDKLERMASVIGKENIIVRRYDGKEHFEGGSIYSDFLSAIGLTMTEEYTVSKEVRNSGLYGNTHEIKRVLNSILKDRDRKVQMFLMERLQEFSDVSQENYPSEMFSQEEIHEILDRYGPGNRKVAEEYLQEAGGELFDNTVKDVPKWEKENPYMLDDVIRLLGTTSVYFYHETIRLKQELNTLTKQTNKEIRALSNDLSNLRNSIKHPLKAVCRQIAKLLKPDTSAEREE